MQVEVFPNPNTCEFTLAFELQEKQDVAIEITDMLGKTIFRKQLNGNRGWNTAIFNLSSDGVYNMNLTTGKNVVNKRIVVRGRE
ncbi:MAG: T9SS type A sorting domain-containing protein [Bacteroidia bacterium]|nr:T9SS type A sorting domain-containing protein [Bacteroidia bacterium]